MPVLVSRIIIVNIAIFLLACNTGTQGIIEVIVLEGTTDFQLMCPEVPKTVNIVSYKWFYNQDPIDRLRKNILSFDSVDRKESGIYACNIETTDVSYNYTYLLKVEYPPELLSFPSSVKFVHPNSSVSLECQCDGEPVPVVTWMKDGQPYRKGNKLRLTDGVLDEGKYQCNASNKYASIISRPTQILVHVPAYFTSSPKSDFEIEQHGSLTLDCQVQGKPKPIVLWFKDGIQLSSNNVSKSSGILKISDTSIADSGNYTCLAGNSDQKISQDFHVKVRAPPNAVNISIENIDSHTVRINYHVEGCHRNTEYPATTINLQYGQMQSETTLITLDPKDSFYVLGGLEVEGQYELDIWAVNEVGSGNITSVNFTVGPSRSSRSAQEVKSKDKNENKDLHRLSPEASHAAYTFFIIVGVMIGLAMLVFIIIVIGIFCRRLLYRVYDDYGMFDDQHIYDGGILNENSQDDQIMASITYTAFNNENE